MDNFYFCDPEKNTECSKELCYINGGQCKLTSKNECKKPMTNQDKIAEIARTMDTKCLADILAKEFMCGGNCLCEEYCKKDSLSHNCRNIICEWLQKEVKGE